MKIEGFTVGEFHICWLPDGETVQITNTRFDRSAILHGGDFESILSGMVECALLSVRELHK